MLAKPLRIGKAPRHSCKPKHRCPANRTPDFDCRRFPEAAKSTLAKLLQESGNQVETARGRTVSKRLKPRLGFAQTLACFRYRHAQTQWLRATRPAHFASKFSLGANMILIAFTGWGQSRDRSRSKDAGFGYSSYQADTNTLMRFCAIVE